MKVIKLTKGQVALINDEDFVKIRQFRWYCQEALSKRKYARTEIDGKSVSMHQLILGAKTGKEIDHRNGNGLDNRRENLRFCSHKENLRNKDIYKNNKSGFKGVWWDKEKEKWEVGIRVNGKAFFLGNYNNIIRAAQIYDIAAKRYFREFAKTNF